MLLVMGLLSFLISILSRVFGEIMDLKLRSAAYSAVALETRFLTQRFQYDLDRSTQILSPQFGQTVNSLTLVLDGQTHQITLQDGTLYDNFSAETYALTSPETDLRSFTVSRSADQAGRSVITIGGEIASVINSPGVISESQFHISGSTR